VRFLKDTSKKLLSVTALRRLLSALALGIADGVALVLGLSGAAYLSGGTWAEVSGLTPLLVAAWLSTFAAFRLYDRAPSRRNPGALVGAALSWSGLVLVGAHIYPESGLRVGEVIIAVLLALPCVGAFRLLFERGVDTIYRRGLGQTPVVVVGGGEDRARVRRAMERMPGAYTIVGEVDLLGAGRGVDLAELRETLDSTSARGVILVGAERLSDEEFLELLSSVRLRGVPLRVVPGALNLMRSRPVLLESVGLPLLEVRYPRLDNTQRALKRALDVAVSAGGLVLLSPLFAAVALAVWATSPGPVLFRQKRIGADGKVFVCYMFRSMSEDAERWQEELEPLNEADGPVFKMRDDPRVTPVGRFLRRWSIDELPQLLNVLRGEMSLVGPRPLPVRDFQRMEEAHKRRLGAIPGMTGYWQISGRSNLSFEEMVSLDLYYIENWSLSFDVKIILRTLGAVVRREGAY
jgi:exopolysaccharide biosynthesis polyprenyl glycosylphosphotransferase